MKSLYEILNIDLAQEYTKERKLAKLKSLGINLGAELEAEAIAAVNAMDIPESDEQHHWTTKLGKAAAADLLTLGKVQPENMLALANLPRNDFTIAVKVATITARNLNQATIDAEKELSNDTIPDSLLE